MAILDSQGRPIQNESPNHKSKKSLRNVAVAVAAFVAAVALFIGNIDKIWSTVSGWIHGKPEKTIVVNITKESLLDAAKILAKDSEQLSGTEKTEANATVKNLTTASSELRKPIILGKSPGSSPPWLLVAFSELGQQEVAGSQHNQRIIEYIESANPQFYYAGDEFPWVSFFVNWVFMQVGIKGTNNGMARSWLKWGHSLEIPKPGAVAVFARPKPPWAGDVGFFLTDTGQHIVCISGNVGNAVRITAMPKSRLLGYRWPDDA